MAKKSRKSYWIESAILRSTCICLGTTVNVYDHRNAIHDGKPNGLLQALFLAGSVFRLSRRWSGQAGLLAILQEFLQITAAMENGDNLQRVRLRSVNDQVRVDREKLYWLVS